MSEQVSKCCGAEVKQVFGRYCGGQHWSNRIIECTKCGKPCDVKPRQEQRP